MSGQNKIKIIYFGSYDPSYTRVRTIIKGLRRNDVEVVECSSGHHSRLMRLIILVFKFLKMMRGADVLMVSEAGQSYVPLAKILSLISRKPLLFDAFLSYYHVKIEDEKSSSKNSLKGKYFYYLDKLSCKLADLVLLDTEEHIDYFCETFNLPREKFRALPVGSDEEIFYPRNEKKNTDEFLVLLASSFYPLHGVEYVVEAAKLLEKYRDIKFLLVGNGPTAETIERLIKDLNIKNIEFRKNLVPPSELANLMSGADVCLGQFGATAQVQMVVPAKIYDNLAMAKPVITGFSKAVSRILTDKENVIFCPVADRQAIADAIILLKNNPELRRKISKNGYRLFKENFSLSKIGKKLKSIINELIKKDG